MQSWLQRYLFKKVTASALEAPGAVGRRWGSGPHAELLLGSRGGGRASCHPPGRDAAQVTVSRVRDAVGRRCVVCSVRY